MIKQAVNLALRRGIRKGVVGGSGPWLVVAVAAGAVKLARRRPRDAHPLQLRLQPGDRYSITVIDPTHAP